MRHPQTLKWPTHGFFLYHTSCDVFSLTADVGQWFKTWISAAKHLVQNFLDKPNSSNKTTILLANSLLACSVTLFCYVLLQMVCFFDIPHSSRNLWNSFDMYSPLLSSRSYLIFFPVKFSAYALNLWKQLKVSLFLFYWIQHFEGWTIIDKWHPVFITTIGSDSNLMHIRINSFQHFCSMILWYRFVCIFPAKHGLQIGSGFAFESSTKPSTSNIILQIFE